MNASAMIVWNSKCNEDDAGPTLPLRRSSNLSLLNMRVCSGKFVILICDSQNRKSMV
jgi:hypothetical protein